ncbi:hypothetical protein TRIUR3_31290 [Triticum urartu]|uniref:Uncharacterized protein n=1 Tax=Triticum urartu TaxID=4572 RepID=M7ZT72_TRIUA|nr:hypothetical protein TRIUR3_31290 [Triticum urartu]
MEAGSGAHIKLPGRGQLLPGTDRRVVFLSGPFRAVMDATERALGLVSGCRLKQQVYSSCLLLSGFLDKIKHSLGPLPQIHLPNSARKEQRRGWRSTSDPGSGRSSDGGGEASATLGGGSARVG